jgi:hypothetical protein
MLAIILKSLLSAAAGIDTYASNDENKAMALELIKYDFERVCRSNAHLDPDALGDYFVDATGHKRAVSAAEVAKRFRLSADDADTIVKFIDLTFDVLRPSRQSTLAL